MIKPYHAFNIEALVSIADHRRQRYSELRSLKSLNIHHLAPASDSRRKGYSRITGEGQTSQERGEGGKHSRFLFYCQGSISGMNTF